MKILERIFDYCSQKIETEFCTAIENVEVEDDGTFLLTSDKGEQYKCKDLVMATGRSGSKWSSQICDKLGIKQRKNRVDIGVRVELPAEIFKHITDDVTKVRSSIRPISTTIWSGHLYESIWRGGG